MLRKRVYAQSFRPFQAAKRRRYQASKKMSRSKKAPTAMSLFARPSPATVAGARLRTKFIYAEKGITLNPSAGGIAAAHVFSINGLFDPDITGVGHQPAGFDQVMAIYEQYIVLAVTYKVTIASSDANASNVHGVTITDAQATSGDPRVYMENGNTQWNYVTGKSETGPSVSKFSGHVNLCDIHGKTYQEYIGDDTFRGLATTNPSESAFLHIWAADAAAGDTGTQLVTVEIQYDVLCTGGKLNQLS